MNFLRYIEHVLYPPLFGRSSSWAKVRQEWLDDGHDFCSVCGTKDDLEVHHILPYHLFPELELDLTNLITVCRPHHFLFGHFCDWVRYNPDVIEDCLVWYTKIKV